MRYYANKFIFQLKTCITTRVIMQNFTECSIHLLTEDLCVIMPTYALLCQLMLYSANLCFISPAYALLCQQIDLSTEDLRIIMPTTRGVLQSCRLDTVRAYALSSAGCLLPS